MDKEKVVYPHKRILVTKMKEVLMHATKWVILKALYLPRDVSDSYARLIYMRCAKQIRP
jgi:hypothetical protein